LLAKADSAAERGEMLTIIVVLGIWSLLSLPLSVVLGFSLRAADHLELVGMDGDDAVYRRSNGTLQRVRLIARTSA
jgi:hypothetical protein